MVQQRVDHLDCVIAQYGLMERRATPSSHAIGIGAVLEQPLDAMVVMPVLLAEQHGRKAVFGKLAALHQDLQHIVVVALRRVIRSLPVVRIRAALEQQASQLRVVRHSGGPIDGALKLRLGLVVLLVEPCVRAGAGIQQRLCRAHETIRSRAIEPEIFRKTEMRERVPIVRTAFRRGIGWIE